MNEKICLITGANSGIGKAAAIEIAQKGFRVIIGCRNRLRGEEALKEIKTSSTNEDIELLVIDLSSKKSIQDAVNEFQHDHLDVLVHNAAEFDISRKKPVLSSDGIESVWATNHVGPVLLTQLLMEKMKASKHARIVTISSKGLIVHPKLEVDLEDPEFKNRKFSVAKTYTFLATSLNLKNTTGKYFDERNTTIKSSKYSTDPENIRNIMDQTMK